MRYAAAPRGKRDPKALFPSRVGGAVLLLALLLPQATGAQEPGDPVPRRLPLTLAEALERAREASPRLGELEARLAARQAEDRRARAERRPEVDVSAGYSRLSSVPELSVFQPGIGTTVIFPDIPNRYTGRLDLELPLWTGGRIRSRIDAAGHLADAARGDLAAGLADLDLAVTESYWALVVFGERERVLARAIETFEAHLADAENRRRFGLAAANEVLAVKVERDRAELARLEAEESVRLVEADLARLLALGPEVAVEPSDTLEAEPAPEEELEALVAEARATRPEVAALEARVAAAELAVRAAQGARRPALGLAAGYDYARPNPRILPLTDETDDSWDVSLRLTYRLFDGGKVEAEVAAAQAEAEAARWRLEELELALRQEVTAAVTRRRTAGAAVAVAQVNRASAQENVRVARDRFRHGLIPSSELLDAETALLAAGLDLTAARARQRLAEARLTRALGRRP